MNLFEMIFWVIGLMVVLAVGSIGYSFAGLLGAFGGGIIGIMCSIGALYVLTLFSKPIPRKNEKQKRT